MAISLQPWGIKAHYWFERWPNVHCEDTHQIKTLGWEWDVLTHRHTVGANKTCSGLRCKAEIIIQIWPFEISHHLSKANSLQCTVCYFSVAFPSWNFSYSEHGVHSSNCWDKNIEKLRSCNAKRLISLSVIDKNNNSILTKLKNINSDSLKAVVLIDVFFACLIIVFFMQNVY